MVMMETLMSSGRLQIRSPGASGGRRDDGEQDETSMCMHNRNERGSRALPLSLRHLYYIFAFSTAQGLSLPPLCQLQNTFHGARLHSRV